MKWQTSLIEVEALSQLLNENKVKILFTSLENPVNAVTNTKHPVYIPESMFFDFENVFVDNQHPCANMLPPINEFASKLTDMGIATDTKIVVYDNQDLFSSPRVWWMLKAIGHQQVYVLNGGLSAWIDAKLPTVRELTLPVKSDTLYTANKQYSFVINHSEMQKRFSHNDMNIIDARGKKRFGGTEPDPRPGVRAGHIPNSINLHYNTLINNGKLSEDKQLKIAFKTACPNYEENELVFSCGSGVTACILALAATRLALNNWRVYDGSWSEWGADKQCPVATSN